MHGFYNNNNVKVTGSGGRSSISPQSDDQLILGRRGRYGFTSSAFDPQIHNPLDVDSTLIRYSRATGASLSPSADVFPSQIIDSTKFHPLLLHRSNISPRGSSPSPLSSIENLETPPSKSPPVFATPVKVEEDVLVMDGILVGSVPGGRTRSGPDSGSSSSGNSLYKTEICRAWEDTGNCRYGSKCQVLFSGS
uniref:C3H1-type domain-containing protein n=1 Tax=Nelumbo nucifera TaxID=4432 RepID=A0A822ZEZ5_NELNU|nr:TPA_asm: hypothetical protein HUJ06_014491 [Nelumbo nucifera]